MVSEKYTMAPIPDVIEQIRTGGMVVLVDDERRENEGDLIFAAEHVTPEKINFLVTQGRGLVCVPMNEQRAHELNLNDDGRRGTEHRVPRHLVHGQCRCKGGYEHRYLGLRPGGHDTRPV